MLPGFISSKKWTDRFSALGPGLCWVMPRVAVSQDSPIPALTCSLGEGGMSCEWGDMHMSGIKAGEVGGRRGELRRNAEASMGPSMCMVLPGDASGRLPGRPQDSRFGAQWEDEDWDRDSKQVGGTDETIPEGKKGDRIVPWACSSSDTETAWGKPCTT